MDKRAEAQRCVALACEAVRESRRAAAEAGAAGAGAWIEFAGAGGAAVLAADELLEEAFMAVYDAGVAAGRGGIVVSLPVVVRSHIKRSSYEVRDGRQSS